MLNHIEIIGNIVADPETRTTNSGIPVCTFRIACERDYAAGGAQKETDFVDIVAWREKADFVSRNFTKGMPIAVSGRLQIRKWEDRDGNKRSSAEIVAENVYFAGGDRKRSTESSFKSLSGAQSDNYGDVFGKEEDLPF